MVETSKELQNIACVFNPKEKHWVGDGFWVTTLLSPNLLDADLLSPFVLMDHAAPKHFPPATKPRGVGVHPHRGFETVTFAYQGEVEHRDSHGGGGTIGAGDVQWMTAGSGVVHEEFQSKAFTQSGGTFEMVQLWVNLPKKDKMTEPRYQLLLRQSFPTLVFGVAKGRLIAGHYGDVQGPAKTWTEITLMDLEFAQEGEAQYELPLGHTHLVVVLEGELLAQNKQNARAGELIVFDRASKGIVSLQGKVGTRALVLSGKPLGEPVVAYGPFVMNTKREILSAIEDFNQGKMGSLLPKGQ